MKDSSRFVVLIDFGSTYTKVAVVDTKEKRLIKTDHFPSTVATDARIGLAQCFDVARDLIGKEAFDAALKLSSSSAAGGLRMGVIGLTDTLSVTAGRNAAFGAGAKILKICAGKLDDADIEALAALPLEILLFCGGYENGNSSIIEYNANRLAKSNIHIPIIYAGNSKVAPAVRTAFTLKQKEFYVVKNIIPDVGELDTKQVEAIIRELFLKRIINMKGLDKVSSLLDKMVMPTPAAVLRAGELLSKGCLQHQGLGPTMIVDVGGATTDIHSFAQQLPYEGGKIVGAPETYVKRTVEGDLGLRESSHSLCNEIGLGELVAKLGMTEDEIAAVIDKWLGNIRLLAQTDAEKKVDHAATCGAVRISARRHTGWIEHISSAGLKKVQHGKNLSHVVNVIGTGGPIIFSENPHEILAQVLRDKQKEADILLPEDANLYLDEDYVFFAAGLLREVDEELAFLLMQNSLKKV
jgi:uncharacterized protein (TIGR01319 family)